MRNWAGNLTYRAARLLEPETVEEVQDLVRASRSMRVLGSRHAFSALADTTGDHVSLARMPRIAEIDRAAGTVTVDGATRYGDLAPVLHAAGLALHNLASLPHISIAGACATGTHGSGDRSGNLSTAVRAMDVVRADGELVRVSRSDDRATFPGVVVSLGSLGVITSLTLGIEPAYGVRQWVFEDLPADAFRGHLDEVTSAGDSVSGFTHWRGNGIEQVWVKRRVPAADDDPVPPATFFGARRATVDRHPIRGMSPDAATPQLGVAGPWHERLPHFRLDHTPSSGEELQTEYFVGRADAVAAFDAIDGLRDRIAPLLLVGEIRTIAADDLWLSPAYERDSVAYHFTWKPDWPAVRALLPAIEAALEPFAPRPHWAKLSTMAPDLVRSRYERLPDFADLARSFDPNGVFRNEFVAAYLGS
jgi:xylitol oxidase